MEKRNVSFYLTKEEEKEIVNNVVKKFRLQLIALSVALISISAFSISYGVFINMENNAIRHRIETHERVDSLLRKDLLNY